MQTKKNNLKLFVLLFLAVIGLSAHKAAHPFYLSVTEVSVKSKEKIVEVSCKIFIDDFQQALFNEQKKSVNLQTNNSVNKDIVSKYVQSRLAITIGKPITLKFLGYEIEEDAVWCYFESQLTSNSKNIYIQNNILCNTLSGQANIVHCIYNKQRKSTKLNCPETKASFGF
jgi:hypothetical protein